MNLLEKEKRYSPKTGQLLDETWMPSKYICDYCGAILDPSEKCVDPVYKVQESGDVEQLFYYERIEGHGDVNLYQFFCNNEEFHFCQHLYTEREDSAVPCEFKLVEEWMKNIRNPQSIFFEKNLLATAMYVARLRVVKQLLDKGYSEEQLGLKQD